MLDGQMSGRAYRYLYYILTLTHAYMHQMSMGIIDILVQIYRHEAFECKYYIHINLFANLFDITLGVNNYW